MPFESDAQRKWMYANKPGMARRWAEETPKGKKLPKYKGIENREAHQADQNRRRSSAASPHDPRPNRERSRNAEAQAAIKRSRDDE
ncbi:hypothetical protein UFOVP221_89 [uncultured Caudovirales phage]|uniref:Uncharacterized protein n=1 Tax=uncultured Caudovirales phage TaxID=2100421 RepID=A0A6J7WRY6_9CAUD|nr:hypothetical protein UFOVP221_89 [uncultured Caudovirales phage]